MCKHEFVKVNNVVVCKRCGVTRTEDGKIIFDRKLPSYKPKRRRK